MTTRRSVLCGLGGALAAGDARAQFGGKVGRLYVPFPAGSLTDIVSRQVADLLGPALGLTLVVENRAGAQGAVGMKVAAAAPADGTALVCVGVTTAASNLVLLDNLGYDPIRDFAPVGFIAESPSLLVAAPDLPVSTTADLVSLARREPGRLTYSYGSGSGQVSGELFAKRAGVRVLGVPYKGGLEALTDVIAARISYTFTDFANGLSVVREGRVKGLAVSTSTPFSLAPDIPPVEASGVAPYDISVWFGMAAPARTPPDVIRNISAKLSEVMRTPDLVRRFAGQGLLAQPSDEATFGAFMKSEAVKWAALARETGLVKN